jgi:small subunit ribosomal protein S13
MTFFLQTSIQEKKPLWSALQKLYGLGKFQTRVICRELGFSETIRFSELHAFELEKLATFITQNFEISSDVKRVQLQNIQRCLQIGVYRGFRHHDGLPVRGQRTHGNARTARKLHARLVKSYSTLCQPF